MTEKIKAVAVPLPVPDPNEDKDLAPPDWYDELGDEIDTYRALLAMVIAGWGDSIRKENNKLYERIQDILSDEEIING